MRRVVLVGAVLAAGCGGGDEPAWALQHAVVQPADDGLSGFQVWEFYDRRWKPEKSERAGTRRRASRPGPRGL